ncbi:MAG TPA: hypothetical protein VFF73_18445 [Planctomycetota bacterium]|nr:hypothetical protein [Planctomycetota bacterium]
MTPRKVLRMGFIDLGMEERRLVTRILDQAYQDLRHEIYKTETTEMKEALKRDEKILAGVLEKFGIEKKSAA